MMSRIRGTDTRPERLMRSVLRRLGIPFGKYPGLSGKPDLFVPPNVCVFVDGSFWHGRFVAKVARLSPSWKRKISGNVARDRRVDRKLRRAGYSVARFWDSEVEVLAKALGIKAKKPIYNSRRK